MIPNAPPNHGKNDKLQLSFGRRWVPFQTFQLKPRDKVQGTGLVTLSLAGCNKMKYGAPCTKIITSHKTVTAEH